MLSQGLELLATAAHPLVRWYLPTRRVVVAGRGQRLDPPAGALDVLARHSGGGAVLLDDDLLSADVVVPAGHPWTTAGPLGAFDHVGGAFREGLADLGVPGLSMVEAPRLASRRGDAAERLAAAVCYASNGRGEVLHAGRKVVGLAQRHRREGLLIQCGIVRSWRPAPLLATLGAATDDAAILGAAVGLDELIDPVPSNAALAAAVSARLLAADDATPR